MSLIWVIVLNSLLHVALFIILFYEHTKAIIASSLLIELKLIIAIRATFPYKVV